jgi:hypothetical protein
MMIRVRPITRIAAVLGLLSLSTVGIAGVASAAPGEWESFHRSFSFVERNTCDVPGLTTEQTITSDGRERLTEHAGGVGYFASLEQVVRTVTNVATGESVTQVTDLRFADLKFINNPDGTVTFIAQRPSHTVYIQEGEVIARSAGLMRWRAFYDDGGTPTDESDDVYEEVVLKDVGHPADFCATVIQAIG